MKTVWIFAVALTVFALPARAQRLVTLTPTNERADPGEHLEPTRPHFGLGAGGVAIAAGAYLSLVVAMLFASSAFNGTGDFGPTGNWLYVPLVGPIVSGALSDRVGLSPLLIAWIVVDELLQLGGVAMFTGYLLQPAR